MKKLHLMVFLVILLLGVAQPTGRSGVAAASLAPAHLTPVASDHSPGPVPLAIVPMDEREPGAHPGLGYLAFVVVAVLFVGAAVVIYRRYR